MLTRIGRLFKEYIYMNNDELLLKERLENFYSFTMKIESSFMNIS